MKLTDTHLAQVLNQSPYLTILKQRIANAADTNGQSEVDFFFASMAQLVTEFETDGTPWNEALRNAESVLHTNNIKKRALTGNPSQTVIFARTIMNEYNSMKELLYHRAYYKH